MILNTTWQIVSAMGVEAICVFFITYFISTKGRVAERSYYDVVIEKAGLEERLRENLEENAGLKQKIQNLHLELQEARDKALVLDIEKKNLERTNMQFDAFLKSVDEQTKLHFENLANKIFDEKMNKFSKMSREGLHYLLEPVKENMQILKRN